MANEFVLFGMRFSTYWTVFGIGVIAMIVLNIFRGKKKNLHVHNSILLTISIIAISFIGAKILYYIEKPHVLISNGIQFDGVSFFGAVFLVPVAMLLVSKISKRCYYELMDYLSPSLMLMLAILRIGCFLSGCCGGATVTTATGECFVFPSQLTECAIDLLIMIGLLLYDKFWETVGRLYFFIMVYYGVARFFLEFFRNTPKHFLGLSNGQCFAVISIAVGGYMLYFLGKKERQKSKQKKANSIKH